MEEFCRLFCFTFRALVMALACPTVMQSGQTHFPARSKDCRILGNSIHQQWALPGGAPQLNRVPHSSQTSLSMSLLCPMACPNRGRIQLALQARNGFKESQSSDLFQKRRQELTRVSSLSNPHGQKHQKMPDSDIALDASFT